MSIRTVFSEYRFRILFAPLLAVAAILTACTPTQGIGVAYLKSYDADTLTVDIPGWPPVVGDNISVRVRGIDAPEIRGECPREESAAIAARDAARAFLRQGDVVLRNIGRDKYFRLLADVYVDGESLAGYLLDQGMAREYSGGTRQGWCD